MVIACACCAVVVASGLPSADDVLDAAHEHAVRMETLDYSFRFSLHPENAIRFRSKGVMTRVDVACPEPTWEGNGDGKHSGLEEVTYAFDGEKYQQQVKGVAVIGYSSQPLGGVAMAGPCWTPVEVCYRWLRAVQPEFSWQTMRDPAAWELLDPQAEVVEADCNGMTCARVDFHLDNQVRIHVFFAMDEGFLPVRCDVYDPDGGLASHWEVEKVLQVPDPTRSVWIPIRLTSRQEGHEHAPVRSGSYDVLPESVRVNVDIDDAIFTLEPSNGVVNVNDLDGNRVYIPATDEWVDLNLRREQAETDRSVTNARRWRTFLAIASSSVLLIVLGGMFWWRRRREV